MHIVFFSLAGAGAARLASRERKASQTLNLVNRQYINAACAEHVKHYSMW